MNDFYKYIIFVIFILFGCYAYGQSNDPQSSRPPASSHLVEADDWHPIAPEPFEGCDIIINHNAVADKLTIDAVLHNLGYYSWINVVDSAVYVDISCIAKNSAACSATKTLIPYAFDLYVMIDDCDTAQYKVIYDKDSLQIITKRDSKYIQVVPIRKSPCPLCWMQFKGNQRLLAGDIEKDIQEVSGIIVLEKGYYLDFPMEVHEEQYRKHYYNTTELGSVVFFQSDNAAFPVIFGKLVSKYLSRGLIGYGCL